MADLVLFTTALISAIISYITGIIFSITYVKDKKPNRLVWGIAFVLYAIGHTITSFIAMLTFDAETTKFLLWLYVNLSGAGTTGLILFSTIPFITEKANIKILVTFIFMGLYIIGSAIFAFILPDENPFAFINPTTHTQTANMSWWVVELLIPASLFIGIVFIRHYKISGTLWGLLIGLSFLIYGIILFIWPIPEMKPTFYTIRCISVGLLGIGGVLLARD